MRVRGITVLRIYFLEPECISINHKVAFHV